MDALFGWMNGMITPKRDITGKIVLFGKIRKKHKHKNGLMIIHIFRLVKSLKCSQFFLIESLPDLWRHRGFPMGHRWPSIGIFVASKMANGSLQMVRLHDVFGAKIIEDPTYWKETHGQFTDFCWLKSFFYLVLPIFPPSLIYDSILRKNNNLTISINLHIFQHANFWPVSRSFIDIGACPKW